jgi:hypothetical protein
MWSMLMVAGLGLAAEAKLQEGDFVAVIGDSITEQRLYSVYIEDYLLMCQPAQKLRAMHFEGVSGSHLLRDYLRTAQPVPGSDGSPPISRLLR